jgi:hypothetical protein
MRPTPIPQAEVWPGAVRARFGPPEGMPEVATVEALVEGRVASVRLELEPGDLDKLAAGGVVWLSFVGQMVPWSVQVKGPGE